jgi:hypothetical protein
MPVDMIAPPGVDYRNALESVSGKSDQESPEAAPLSRGVFA